MFAKTIPTVAGVMSTFRKAIADLENVAQEQHAESVKQNEIAAQAQAAADAAAAESADALSIKSKMEAIFA